MSPEEISRYSRHLLLPEIGVDGQEKLKKAKVLIAGAGGLGSPVAMYLAAAGVGTLCIADFDQVDLSNLQRQIAYKTSDIGGRKAEVISKLLKEMNPLVNIITHDIALNAKNALDIMNGYQIVADCTDNFQTRYLLNDACVFSGKPYVYGSVFGLNGQTSFFYAKEGPCYRCLYPDPPPPASKPICLTNGVLGVLPGVIGCIMANAVLQFIIAGTSASSATGNAHLLLFNALETKFDEIKIEKDENCPICGKNPSIKTLIGYEDMEVACDSITNRFS